MPLEAEGRAAAKALATLGIETHADLVEHLPREHRERDARPVAALRPATRRRWRSPSAASPCGRCGDRGQKRVEARVFDETGPMLAVWFNQPWIARQLGEGTQVLLYGQRRDRNQFWVKEHELLGAGGAAGARGRARADVPRQRGDHPGPPAAADLGRPRS